MSFESKVPSNKKVVKSDGTVVSEFDETVDAVKATLATQLAGEDIPNDVIKVEHRYSKNHINTLATTTVKSGVGFLHAITINTSGASGNTITVYDNTAGSGDVIAVIDGTSAPVTLFFDVAFATGLTIVTATGTAADITVSYR